LIFFHLFGSVTGCEQHEKKKKIEQKIEKKNKGKVVRKQKFKEQIK
jgi:hypothetical protein